MGAGQSVLLTTHILTHRNLIEELKKELDTATSFSVIMDEASDFGRKEQVSVVLRYVDTDYVIQERLVDIEHTDSTDAESLVQILLSSLLKVGLTTEKLIGQCYDGASNMRGAIAGVQAKVKAIQPKAIYTHCYAHCTNLVLVEATSTNRHARNFFGVLQNLYNFLEASPHRHAKLESMIKEVISKPRIMSVKKLSDTRWACRSDAVRAVSENFQLSSRPWMKLNKVPMMAELVLKQVDLGIRCLNLNFCFV